MEGEEEDRVLLSSLGVTSANPDDIERDILAKARNNAGDGSEAGGSSEEQVLDRSKSNESSSTSHAGLYNKLRAVKIEIDAVASSVEQVKNFARNEDTVPDGNDDRKQGDTEDEQIIVQPSSSTLQEALAAERLRSLKKTKVKLEREISILCKDDPSSIKHDCLIQNLVKEEIKPKRKLKEVQKSSKDLKKRKKTVSFDEDDDFDAVLNAASAGFVETERDELVRKGILTPFHKLKGFERRIQQPGLSSRHNIPQEEDKTDVLASTSIARAVQSMSEAVQARPTTKLLNSESLPKLEAPTRPFQRLKAPLKIPRSLESEVEKNKDTKRKTRRPLPGKKWRKLTSLEKELLEETEDAKDDLVSSSYEEENQEVAGVDDTEPPFMTLEGGLRIPENIFSKLFDYQKVGVQWLWELHCQRAGGIIGDEMGLGKTIQVLSFLGGLHFSKMYKPSIIICPVTLLRQWKREAQKWYPAFLVELLHDSANNPVSRKKRAKSYDSDYESEELLDSDSEGNLSSRNTKKWDTLINRVLRSESGLLITTYEQLRLLGEKLVNIEWGYAVLDEGHRIRNPNAEVTLVCKQLQTVHRIIMTGAPIQNKLTELWSLFDFVFPGKLGVLPIFEAEFAVPISVGGYANASPLQVSTAYRCAVVLRDLIMPYLLRRMKADVNAQLPKKTEHVLFCSLTEEQRSVYRAFLASSEVEQIFDGNRNSLYGIDVMRKICNHPDLLEREHSCQNPDYGNPERSGKMKVVSQVLKVWKEQGHRVLLFAQTQQMLDILENFLMGGGYNYRRMDGLTPIKQRMTLMDEFNNSDDVFVFILTTRVGGLGTNLTGANRVIIFDPDWNPSTDMQARERAWRIGQTKDVTVYRLITRGTIEEKVYHRQIYKHFLTNKILKNPQQRRFFKARDMKDLFTLNDDGEGGATETSNIFSQITDDVNVVGVHKDDQDKGKSLKVALPNDDDIAVDKGNNSGIGPSKKKGKEKADQSDNEVDQETNILRNLFDAHGIHSAMNHDAIMNAHDEEKIRLEEQASQVAQRAAEALRQSRMLRSQESISVPTWTGKSGAAGAPSSVRLKFGSTINSQLINNSKPLEESSSNGASRPNGFAAGASAGKVLSSAELLARIRGNQERAVGDGLEHQFGIASSSASRGRAVDNEPSRSSLNLSGVQPELLIRQICTFLQLRGGSTSSASIVQHFKDRIPSKDLPLFKNLLKEIATLEKDPNGSKWVIKPEYQQQ
ncbi:protein CHROMATIN REMODELING 8 [Cornus florida]|uniref:protein CHROMATIN REMODELING 8 n=1 Tax=Cornus florida TaxID=4283 RepID=UPI0028A05296|nr:protein CHROMATIN REMODELING 8 [Cornus florida]XP_059626045.1 protein CHROMATIN REMODELING 8 [Cornus florida]XP_059626046.1 protein CHROMATIN REMODELING 8 [Cornus florida]